MRTMLWPSFFHCPFHWEPAKLFVFKKVKETKQICGDSDPYQDIWPIILKRQTPPWSCVCMQVTAIPLSPHHQPQAPHCELRAACSLEGEGRKLPHITTPVRQFLMAAPPPWPDRVWHMLQWRLTGRQTQRNVRGALALKQSIVKGNPALPTTHMTLAE